jgi:hypothetical protein
LGVELTRHSEQRERKRCGVPKKAVARLAEIAFEKGLRHSETKGRLNRYITSLWGKNTMANNIRVYGDKVFIFCDNILITVLNLPTGCIPIARKLLARKKEDTDG